MSILRSERISRSKWIHRSRTPETALPVRKVGLVNGGAIAGTPTLSVTESDLPGEITLDSQGFQDTLRRDPLDLFGFPRETSLPEEQVSALLQLYRPTTQPDEVGSSFAEVASSHVELDMDSINPVLAVREPEALYREQLLTSHGDRTGAMCCGFRGHHRRSTAIRVWVTSLGSTDTAESIYPFGTSA